MSIINRVFNGKLNLDVQNYRVPQGDYVDALNITRDSPGEGQDIVVTNIVGNVSIVYSLPSGTNKVIGKFPDKIRNRVYYSVWNSNDFDLWLYYDGDSDTIVKLIENITDTDGDDVLAFDPSYKINHIDIIYSDTNGDMVLYTDGLNTPRKFNVEHIINGDYTSIKRSFIEVAKTPPLGPPSCVYGTDTTLNSNSLRRKLFMFAYRFQYDDYEKTSFSTFSKIPLPIGYYGSDNDTDNTNNNFITLTVETGEQNVIAVEIMMRYNIGDAWSDFVQVISLNKEQLNIPDNSNYDYLFYNDNIYPPVTDGIQYVDGVQVIPLFDWVPQKAYNQALANGSNIVYGAITEGYNNIPINELDVTITAENVTNSPPDTDPPSITYIQVAQEFTFTVNGSVPTGTNYKIYIFFNGNPSLGQTFGVRLVAEYTSIGGDTVNDVASNLYNDMNSFSANPSIIASGPFANSWNVNFGSSGSYVFSIQTVAGSGGGNSISTEKVWMWDANYIFGQVYVDEQNRDMPGVTTFTNPTDSDNDYSVTTPTFSEDGGTPQTPVISAEVNHVPPTGSTKYYWVRRRQTYANFLQYMICDFQEDTDFMYFCLASIEQYKADNSQFIYGTAPITNESRIRVMAGITADAYNGDVWSTNNDYQILGTVIKTLSGGVSPDDDRTFIKVTKPTTSISPAYTNHMLVMVYTPLANPTSAGESVYWEWGEAYGTYTGYTIAYSGLTLTFEIGETITGGISGATGIVVGDDSGQLGISDLTGTFQNGETITGGTSGATATLDSISSGALYHRGMDQDQTSFQPATFTWEEGDVYFHDRSMYDGLIGSPPYSTETVPVMDANWSDFFDSAVNDNGRAQVIEVNAQQVYNPVLIRFGGSYQSGTTINEINKFYFEDFQEADRGWGDIRKLYIRNRYMYVYQKFKVGVVPILLQIVRDTEGNPLEANSDILLNKINYPYNEDVGIGDIPESFASDKDAMYGADDYKGVVWRLSQDGFTILSVLYECNSFFVTRLPNYRKSLNNGNPPSGGVYTGDPTVYGAFDANTNKYIIALEEINRYDEDGGLIFNQAAATLSFNEVRNPMEGFESPLSYLPESMTCLDTTFISFKDGVFWKHGTFATRCNFYGVQYDAFITVVFNDNSLQKKSWLSVAELADDIWECPSISSNVISQNSQNQESKLLRQNFRLLEGDYHASFLRDINSIGGWINGSFLKGNYLVVKFMKRNANELVYLNGVSVFFKDSPLTNK